MGKRISIPNPWRVVSSTVEGTSHAKVGSPCQDGHLLEVFEGSEQILILIASDGAGSATHSDEGARIACASILEQALVLFRQGDLVDSIDRDVARQWIERAAAAIEIRAHDEGRVSRDYACTLLAAFVGVSHTAFLQIGDGVIILGSGPDEWSYVFWPQHGEYINSTVFLTDASAREGFSFEAAADCVHEVAIMTDGIESLVLNYANRDVHFPFFRSLFPAVRGCKPGVDQELSSRLGEYLASPQVCDRTDDDKTLILATRISTEAIEPSRSEATSQ